MKGILAIIILVALVYFGYTVFSKNVTYTGTVSEQRYDGLEDIQDELPGGYHEATLEVDTSVQLFIAKIHKAIRDARAWIRGEQNTSG